MPTTTRLSLPYPGGGDSPDGPAQIGALAQALDNAAIDLAEGTFAARPAASIRGRYYYATDVGVLYRDRGSSWMPVTLEDGQIVNAKVAANAAIAESKLALASDAAAGTASRRTLGTGATQATAGNDSRLSDQRTPSDGSVTLAKLATAIANAIVKPGTVFDFAGATLPDGYLLCDGSAVSRDTYADLFAAIGITHGSGDGSTTFNLPDARGRVTVGKGTHAEVDTLGESDGLAVGSRRLKHTHTIAAEAPATDMVATSTDAQGYHGHTAYTSDGSNSTTWNGTSGVASAASIKHTHGVGVEPSGSHAHYVYPHAHYVNSHSHGGASGPEGPAHIVFNKMIKV